jgi:hypothetical protein
VKRINDTDKDGVIYYDDLENELEKSEFIIVVGTVQDFLGAFNEVIFEVKVTRNMTDPILDYKNFLEEILKGEEAYYQKA